MTHETFIKQSLDLRNLIVTSVLIKTDFVGIALEGIVLALGSVLILQGVSPEEEKELRRKNRGTSKRNLTTT